jgi:hypothetical protein
MTMSMLCGLPIRMASPGILAKWISRSAAGLGLVLATAAAQATPLMIDDFITSQTVSATSGTPIATSSTTALEALGGERDIRVEFLSGSTVISLSTNPYGGEFLIHDSGAAVKGSSLTVWDGPDMNANLIDFDGLGGVDLLQGGGLDALQISDLLADVVGDVTLTIYDAGDPTGSKWSSAVYSIPGAIFAPVNVTIPYSSFTTLGPGGAADFSNVGAISLAISNTTTGSLDVQMSSLQAVPEPSGALLALGGLACLAGRMRSRRV